MTTEHWKKYPRVTAILDVVSKGKGFEYWLRDHGKQYDRFPDLLKLLEKLGEWFFYNDIKKWLNDHVDSKIISGEACDIGSEIHDHINNFHTNPEKFDLRLEDTPRSKIIVRSVENYIRWFDKSNAVVAAPIINGKNCVGSELPVWSDKYQFRGTLDRVVFMDNKLIVDDLKNASAIRKGYVLQVEMYRIAFEEMTGLKIDGLRIIRIDKGTGEIEIKKYKPQKSNEKLIKQIIALYNWNKSNEDTSIDTEIIR